MLPGFVKMRKDEHPDAVVAAHPECPFETTELADYVGSTTGILRFCAGSSAQEFIIATEVGILHRLRKENPDKRFVPLAEQAVCLDMKKTTLESVARALQEMTTVITIPPQVAQKALAAVQRMVEVG